MHSIIEWNLCRIINYMSYLLLIMSPFRDQFRFTKITTGGVIAVIFLVECAVIFFAQATGYKEAATVLYLTAFALLPFISVKEKASKLLFSFMVVLNYRIMVTAVSIFIKNMWWPCMTTVFTLAITFPFMWKYMDRQVRPLVNSREPGIQKAWETLWVIPTVFYAIFCNSFYTSGNIAFSLPDYGKKVWNVSFVILLNASYFLVFRLTKSFLEENQKNLQLLRENNQLLLMAKQYENIQEKIEVTLRARHDIRHHMTVIDAYLKAGDQEGLKVYLKEYRSKLPDGIGLPVCENRAVDAVASYYIDKAKEAGIQTETSFCIPASLPVPESDFCSILGNLLENAYEACTAMKSGQRFIRITGQIEGIDMLTLVVENSFEGEIKKLDGIFLSTKRAGNGLGIASVTSLTEKNKGTVKIDYDKGIFCFCVFLRSC